jgi:hypothetical protein
MMQKSTTFTTILRVKKCHFHYDMQKNSFYVGKKETAMELIDQLIKCLSLGFELRK